jgi:hypothetical protein
LTKPGICAAPLHAAARAGNDQAAQYGRHRAEVTSLAARYRLPAVYPFRFFSELGGLLSYGNDVLDNYRRAAI